MSNDFRRFCWQCNHTTCREDREDWLAQLRGIYHWLDAFSGNRRGYFYRNLSRAAEFVKCSLDCLEAEVRRQNNYSDLPKMEK